ncbi:ribose transport system permease protein [Palleronia aestuarii]|uniref:Ribose transport system permease protein n=1 Tax=Palleronia aestuarii TaxID=568105 RepID=A0A2W7MW78_9RHOB|nr:ABC transporter permease [Palleronia aestuarii]PZX12188.1 ribose transport system permease protein [Palleronia aestuarii]
MARRNIPFLRAQRLEQEALTLGIAALIALALAIWTSAFLNGNNLASLQTAIAPNLIVATGMMTLFLIGRFDLSVGAVMGLAGIATAWALGAGASTPLACLAGLAVGLGIGALNGLFVAGLGINHLIVTLGVLYMTRGIIEVVMSGQKLAGFTGFPEGFTALGRFEAGGLQGMFIGAVILLLLMELMFRATGTGRNLLFLGGNPDAARTIGIRRRRVEFLCFVVSGGLAAVAGILATSRVGMANRYMGEGLEMQIFIACLIGGGSIAGGKGSYVGAFAGVLFISLLTNAFNLLSVPSEWQSIVVGGVLVLVVIADAIMTLRKQNRSWGSILGISRFDRILRAKR